MIPTPPDPFDEWLRTPVPLESKDPRFDVRRARPEEFERVYDVVDAAFGKKRPRAQYDWLYRDNPFGRARCWIVIERASDRLLKTGAGFPWPIWRGNEALRGSFSGDAGTVPDWQRKGLAALRRPVNRSHPWHPAICGVSGPNEGSRTVSRKAGEQHKLLGALRGGVMPLRSKALLERVGAPAIVSATVGGAVDAVFTTWQGWASRAAREAAGHVEQIDRFCVDFDDTTERCMAWPKFWSPHNADFLNWRYLDHPVESYMGLALVEDERPTGYAVICLEGEKATLAEFCIDVEPVPRAMKLLADAIEAAREAGCASLNFFGTPDWRHWPLFRRAGFLPYETANHLQTYGENWEPEVHDLKNWQLTPGDRDFR